MVQLHETQMGQKLITKDIPAIAQALGAIAQCAPDQLPRIAEALERIAKALEDLKPLADVADTVWDEHITVRTIK
jgi:hypothetical protein